MARILGLDLGSHSVKGVLLETTLRGYTVKAAVQAPTPEGAGSNLDRVKQALVALVAQEPLAADTVVVSLPGSAAAIHPISLPFSDAKKIDATLGFEVESQLPYDLSEAVFDYQLASTDEKGAQLLVGVVKRTELTALLESMKDSKLEPRIITLPGLAYQNLLPTLPAALMPESPEDAVAIVDVGHERTTIAIGRPGGAIEFTRTLPGGGQLLTKALATEFKLSHAEAQAWKEQYGAVASQMVGPDAERAGAAFVRALSTALRELKPTFKSYQSRGRRQVGRIILCGGTSKLRGLAEQLERDLGISTRVLESVGDANTPTGPEFAQAFSLALRGMATGAKAPRFNLRRGDFAFKSDFDFVREKVGQLVGFTAVLLVLLIASGIIRNSVLERRDKQVDAMLCDITQRILGKCEKNYDVALNLLQGKESPASGIPKRTARTLLAELTAKIPTDLPLTMDQIVIELDRINLRCETTSSKQVEDLIAALKTHKCFKEVKEGKLEKSKDGTKVQVRLDIQVECPEDGKGG